jgi:hypothetical protein
MARPSRPPSKVVGFSLIILAVVSLWFFYSFDTGPYSPSGKWGQLTGMSRLLTRLPLMLVSLPFAGLFGWLGILCMRPPRRLLDEPPRQPLSPAGLESSYLKGWRRSWPEIWAGGYFLAVALLSWIEYALIIGGRPKALSQQEVVLEALLTMGIIFGVLGLVMLLSGLFNSRGSSPLETMPSRRELDGEVPVFDPEWSKTLLSDDPGQRYDFDRLLEKIAGLGQWPSAGKRWLAWLVLLILGFGTLVGFYLLLMVDAGTIGLSWDSIAVVMALPVAIFGFTLFWFFGQLYSYEIDVSGFHRRSPLGIGSWSVHAGELDRVMIVCLWNSKDRSEPRFQLKLRMIGGVTRTFPVFPALEAELQRQLPSYRTFFETARFFP